MVSMQLLRKIFSLVLAVFGKLRWRFALQMNRIFNR